MALPGVAGIGVAAGSVSSRADAYPAAASYCEDPNKKIRKPYTISKSRESWTEQEHDRFLEALQLFDRDWKKIEAFVASKTVIQIRSHAQKYFLKVQKNGTGEHVPPPRPKRKAAHPYPQKASKNASLSSQAADSVEEPLHSLEQGNTVMRNASSAVRNSNTNTVPSWAYSCIQPVTASQPTKDDAPLAAMVSSCSSGSMGSSNGTQQASEIVEQEDHIPSFHVLPDFARVYSFLGSMFDPSTSDHLQKLQEMDPIDAETVLLLMRNLAVNLTSSEFESHRTLLSSYEAGRGEVKSFGVHAPFIYNEKLSLVHQKKKLSLEKVVQWR
ncbi:Transcription factor ASG4 [Apostasia shenzhenica]|uniref:Transcription factor ASG4 n=1 Tax=Apostasia shenzhenica TaxID=1088818 RepID=A0A2I0BET1_9ASPA|nr:Transcription factor ASG4 [Apostasia shenzhenica]